MLDSYWFWQWIKKHRVRDEATLRAALSRPRVLDAFLNDAPRPVIGARDESSGDVELTAGKGIDLTGTLGCRHIDCLKTEVDGLFRHVWHYFDRVILPDAALVSVVNFKSQGDRAALVAELTPLVLVLRYLDQTGGGPLVVFEIRVPSCRQHHQQHAREAGIAQAITNTSELARQIATGADIGWEEEHEHEHGHIHIEYTLDYALFEHRVWGTICSASQSLPSGEGAIRVAVAEDVVQRYLAELSADALAARRSKTALGSTTAFYRRLLATHPAPQVEEVAFELALPITKGIGIGRLIALRKNEKPSFQRLQSALRQAIEERLKSAAAPDPTKIAAQIRSDLIDPALRSIRDRLTAATTMAKRGAATGIALGSVAATIGLLTPLGASAIGAGLTVTGAAVAASSVKKAVDDYLATDRDVSMSDMYFLWQAHKH